MYWCGLTSCVPPGSKVADLYREYLATERLRREAALREEERIAEQLLAEQTLSMPRTRGTVSFG